MRRKPKNINEYTTPKEAAKFLTSLAEHYAKYDSEDMLVKVDVKISYTYPDEWS